MRTTLLSGSCSWSDTPEVWQWVRSMRLRGSVAPKPRMISCHSTRAALSLAASMKKFMPTAKKKLSRGAKASTSMPRATAARTYSRPSASVNASSCVSVAPASCM